MSKKMIKALATALSITATAIQSPIKMNESPFLAGGGLGAGAGARNAIMTMPAAVGGAGVILVQGHDATDLPTQGDAGWYTIATLNAASALLQEIELARWMRTNITTLGTGTITVQLEGVQ